MRGFIGQEATHAGVDERVLREYMVVNGIDPAPILDQIKYVFQKMLAPTASMDSKRRLNHLCDRLWLIAAIEHYTAVMGDFALNCAWDDHDADPTMVDLFHWHGSEESTSAGGIGITPILPMLALASRLGVDWTMVYAGRSRSSLPFVDVVARFGKRVQIRTDDVEGLPTAAELPGAWPEGNAVYACGPA